MVTNNAWKDRHNTQQWRRNEFESLIILFVVALHFFGSKSTVSRFVERFRDGQYSFASFSFAVLLLMVRPSPVSSHL